MKLEREQYELLGKFVEAHLSTAQASRGPFIATWPHNDPQATFSHSQEQDRRFHGNLGDAEILADAGLLRRSSGSSGNDTFHVLAQGIEAYQAWSRSRRSSMSEQVQDSRTVFVVHGRNEVARKTLFDFLRSIGLRPLEWSQAVASAGKGAPFIGEVLDNAFSQARAVVVLLTGDDLAMLAPTFQKSDDAETEKQPTPQARPNVLFEAGMAFGRASDRTILVQLGTLRPFSDIAGRQTVPNLLGP